MSSSIISEESIDLKADGLLDSFDGEMVLPEMDAKQLKTHAAGIVKTVIVSFFQQLLKRNRPSSFAQTFKSKD